MKAKKISIVVIIALIFIAFVGNHYYSKIYRENLTETTVIHIPTNSTFEEVQEIIAPHLKKPENFKWVAEKKKYPKKIRSGKFTLKAGMSSNDLVNYLRSGKQTAVKLTYNNQNSLEELAGRIAKQIEPDSLDLLETFKNKIFLEQNGFTEETALGMYIPNSYQVYWNTSPEKLQKKMLKEYNRFWNSNRVSKAQKQNLTIEEVITLASIVQQEAQANISERATIAGLYLNRYHKGWYLGADPTIKYILKKKYGKDFVVKRVLYKDLKIESPYNTYIHKGFPPGPICMPDISSIDAVLNPVNHDYYFMCAGIDLNSHAFAKTKRQHNRNAKKYQKWLTKQGIMR